jgi:hypothetical protein
MLLACRILKESGLLGLGPTWSFVLPLLLLLLQFADTILKKYSSTIATIFTAITSWALFGHKLTMNFLIGVSIVFISMHQFFTFGDKATQKPGRPAGMVYSPSMEHIRVSDSTNGSSDRVPEKSPLLPR